MGILTDNKILQAAEAQVEAGMTPEARDDYLKVVVAGLRTGLKDGANSLLASLKTSPKPLDDCARGAANVVLMLRAQSRNTMPLKAMIPAGFTLTLKAMEFAERARILKVGKDELVAATNLYSNYMFKALKITQPMLDKAAQAVTGILDDGAKMEIVKRRVGAVKDPRASVPTLPEEAPNGV